jgi:hypothetical protein
MLKQTILIQHVDQSGEAVHTMALETDRPCDDSEIMSLALRELEDVIATSHLYNQVGVILSDLEEKKGVLIYPVLPPLRELTSPLEQPSGSRDVPAKHCYTVPSTYGAFQKLLRLKDFTPIESRADIDSLVADYYASSQSLHQQNRDIASYFQLVIAFAMIVTNVISTFVRKAAGKTKIS